MSTNAPVERDERTVAVENAGYRWAYSLFVYALLIDVAARSLLRREQPWDLLGLVVVSGILLSAYQARHGLLTRKSGLVVVLVSMAAAALAAVLGLLLR